MATANTTPSPMPLTPLQLSGFLAGDTIRLRGDTGELQFSVQLSVAKKLFPENPDPLDAIAQTTEEYLPSEVSGFLSPIGGGSEVEAFGESSVVTRLRSGAISRTEYFPKVPLSRIVAGAPRRRSRRAGERDAFERLLRRRSFPVKPCSSYALFVMGNWGDAGAESSSFAETSKRVASIWSQLQQEERKVYEEMASKDKARYKWQSELFMSKGV